MPTHFGYELLSGKCGQVGVIWYDFREHLVSPGLGVIRTQNTLLQIYFNVAFGRVCGADA